MTPEQVVLWGRSVADYVAMFDLSTHDPAARMLDCAAGAASFNAELPAEGVPLSRTSRDTQYALTQTTKRAFRRTTVNATACAAKRSSPIPSQPGE